jgi:hypothetical protein
VQITRSTSESATLIVRRDGQAGYDGLPTRITGGRTTIVPVGREESFAIAASKVKLQRIAIDGFHYLLGVDPGDTLVLTDNPCNGWDLRGANWEVNELSAPQIACAARSTDCPEEYSSSPLPGLAADPVCSADEKRCVLMTTYEISAESLRVDGEEMPRGSSFQRGPTVCAWTEVSTVRETVRLFPGVGERWNLSVEEGRIVGNAP